MAEKRTRALRTKNRRFVRREDSRDDPRPSFPGGGVAGRLKRSCRKTAPEALERARESPQTRNAADPLVDVRKVEGEERALRKRWKHPNWKNSR